MPNPILSKSFWSIVRLYKLHEPDQNILLGTRLRRAELQDLRDKGTIPDTFRSVGRVEQLVCIHKSLRILYPNNKSVVYAWLTTPRLDFGGISAMDFIKEDRGKNSLQRLRTVNEYLRHQIGS